MTTSASTLSPGTAPDYEALAARLFNETFAPRAAAPDFTIVYTLDQLRDKCGHPDWFGSFVKSRALSPESAHSADFGVTIGVKDKKGKDCEARVHACRSFSGDAWTLTVRWMSSPKVSRPKKKDFGEALKQGVDQDLEPFKPPGYDKTSRYLFGVDELIEPLWQAWPGPSPSKGLVLVTGETGSLKSQVVRGLIHHYLLNRPRAAYVSSESQRKRLTHLLTFEDPIELLLRAAGPSPAADRSFSFCGGSALDYTPRLIGRDVGDLQTGLMKDCLRQTPMLVYVGELRDPKDFSACLTFAGTGHLIVATAHAGSVVEAMSTLLNAVEAKAPGPRAIFAPRILAVIHLKKLRLDEALSARYEAPIIPAMWRHTDMGVQQLVSDGLVSLLPSDPRASSAESSCLGRSFFAKQMMLDPAGRSRTRRPRRPSPEERVRRAQIKRNRTIRPSLTIAALEDDLNG